jgi:hypothetical protein
MQTTRIHFDDDEAPENVARRILPLFDPGDFLKIKGRFFKVDRKGVYSVLAESVGERCTEVLPIDYVPQPKKPLLVQQSVPKPSVVKSEKALAKPSNEKLVAAVGQTWCSKDARRQTEFVIDRIEGDYAFAIGGRKVALERFDRYKLISPGRADSAAGAR